MSTVSLPTPSPLKPYIDARRVMTSVLASSEKRVLLWIAPRLPRWINSDHLTVLALLAMAGAGLSYWLASAHPVALALVVVFLVINWFGDSLDGTLARVRQRQRPRYGYYVDHVVDTLGIAMLIGGLALSGYMSPLVGLGLLVAYFMVAAEVYLATHSLGTFTMAYFGFGPTELRIVLSFGTLMLYSRPIVTLVGQHYRLFDVGGLVATAGLVVTFLVSAVRNTRTLYRLDALPPAPPVGGVTPSAAR